MIIGDELKDKIIQIVDDYFTGILIRMTGRQYISREKVDQLIQRGIISVIPEEEGFVQDAYFIGKLRPVAKPDKMALKILRQRKHEIILSDMEKYAIDHIEESAGIHITKLKDLIKTDILEMINNKNLDYRNEVLSGVVRPTLIEGIIKRKAVNDIARELRDKTKDMFRNFQRIVSTELTNAVNLGAQDSILKNNPNKTAKQIYVYKIVKQDNALCPHCRKFYVNRNGTPKVYTLADLQSNGDNYGKKQVDWQPTIGAVHPNCRCQLVEIDEGWDFNSKTKELEYVGVGKEKWKNK